ncbi:hypothetical protein B0192_05645 [Leptospira interrogans serovar Australis]|nr:hypothetical protein B0192_05645 [Leptospira interrogans serovar Australis]
METIARFFQKYLTLVKQSRIDLKLNLFQKILQRMNVCTVNFHEAILGGKNGSNGKVQKNTGSIY